jgi:CDP-diacylglycerol pyrophosphatase
MKNSIIARALFILILSITSGCVSNSLPIVRAYAQTAEDHAATLEVIFDRCMTETDQAAKEAICASVKSSIEKYRLSAAELKSIK